MRRFIHRDVLHLELRAGRRIPAAHDGPNPGQQLAEVEGLDQVIVGADLQALDSVLNLVFGREDDDAGVLVAPDRFRDRQSVQLGHHDVEDDHVRPELADQAKGRLAVRCGLYLEALVLQAEPDEVDDRAFVIHDEHPRAAGGRNLGSRLRHLSLNITAVLAKSHLLDCFSAGSQQRS